MLKSKANFAQPIFPVFTYLKKNQKKLNVPFQKFNKYYIV